MAKVVGVSACPECGELQEVHFDTRKYYIKCASCHTFTNYQSKAAKERIKAKLKDSEISLEPEPPPVDKQETLPPTPARPTQSEDDLVIESYGDWY